MKLLILKHGAEYIHALGDTIDCVSLINQLCKKEPLTITVYPGYYSNIATFFPVDSPLRFLPIRDYNQQKEYEQRYDCLRIESDDNFIEANKLTGHTDIKGLYVKAGLNYDERDKYCSVVEAAKRFKQIESPAEPYAFIPEGGSPAYYKRCGFKLNRLYINKDLKIITPPQDALMLSYAKMIENATEIHCHVTSWWRLIDKLPTKGSLFMHHYARETRIKPHEFEFRKPWVQLI